MHCLQKSADLNGSLKWSLPSQVLELGVLAEHCGVPDCSLGTALARHRQDGCLDLLLCVAIAKKKVYR